jgi:hypothetical protein
VAGLPTLRPLDILDGEGHQSWIVLEVAKPRIAGVAQNTPDLASFVVVVYTADQVYDDPLPVTSGLKDAAADKASTPLLERHAKPVLDGDAVLLDVPTILLVELRLSNRSAP